MLIFRARKCVGNIDAGEILTSTSVVFLCPYTLVVAVPGSVYYKTKLIIIIIHET